MKSDFPLVSVIIPAYNAEKFISRTLQSVLSQTYKNIEVLVVDDGSQDRTSELVESFAKADNRVILLKQSNQGVAIARNLAIEKSVGEYIAPIDADDIWYPQKLEKQVQCLLNTDSSVGLVYAWSALIDEEDNIIGKYNSWYYSNIHSIEGEVYKHLLYTNFIGNASVPLIRRNCLEKVGYFNSELKKQNAQGCEDWDIYLRIAERYKFSVVREFLIGYRQVNGSMSRSYISMAKSYKLMMLDSRQKHPEIPNYIFNWSASYFRYYLALQSLKCDDYWHTLIWLYKAVRLDSILLLHTGLYKCLFNIIIQIAKNLILRNSISWLNLKKNLHSSHHKTDITQIEIQNKEPNPWKIYDGILSQRWSALGED
ncbi:glycosyltransferase family 2 protein [Anabaena subtropica]|uniref:Glycosyltransferase family 2 protein n=1 Tax=Anabaena subtropica FACHB-260 TaxID=2692884 RepID=A0ABR8CMM8_9NOST|nr:glycosyltransferase family A protein [Anabaena subtropica]MBD2343065.1 glycosyltransferase family 2 protein [Anabaena subtropica FACHB-260]